MVILLTLLVCLIIALILRGIYAALRSILSNKWLHDEARQDVVHLFNRDLPNGQKQLIPPYTNICRHRAANVTGAQKLHAPPMLLLIDAVSIFPVRKVLFWTVPISNYSIIKQRICRNYMPFNAQMPTRQKHLSVFLSLLRYSPGTAYYFRARLYAEENERRDFSRHRRTAGRRANGL